MLTCPQHSCLRCKASSMRCIACVLRLGRCADDCAIFFANHYRSGMLSIKELFTLALQLKKIALHSSQLTDNSS